MKTFPALIIAALLAAPAAAQKPYQAPDPADPKAMQVNTYPRLETLACPVGVGIAVRVDVYNPVPGHKFNVVYQLRIHEKKGQTGPCLGDRENPNGRGFALGSIDAKGHFRETVDITRKDLKTLTNWPKGALSVVLRFETHVIDATDDRWITPPRTPAIILIVYLDPDGKVYSVKSLPEEFLGLTDEALDIYQSLDAFGDPFPVSDVADNKIMLAFSNGLREENPPATLKRVIAAVPSATIHFKGGMGNRLTELSKSKDPGVAAAAKTRLEEWSAEMDKRSTRP